MIRIYVKSPPRRRYPAAALAKGTAVEMEHTSDRRSAAIIAKHHLAENVRYYDHKSRRNPKATVVSAEHQATNLARRLARATGEAYVVVDAEGLRHREERGRPMLFYGRHHLIEPMGFEVMPIGMYAKLPSRMRGVVLHTFGAGAVDPHASTQVLVRAARA